MKSIFVEMVEKTQTLNFEILALKMPFGNHFILELNVFATASVRIIITDTYVIT